MPSESGGPPGIPEDRLAEVAIRSGKVQPSQAAEARELAAKMRGLGVERDLLGALVDKKIITSDVADDLRRQATGAPMPDVRPEAPPLRARPSGDRRQVSTGPAGASAQAVPPSEDVEIVFDAEPLAEPEIAAAPLELPRLGRQVQTVSEQFAPCANHPDRKALATCKHCSKPVCAECIVRNQRGSFCSSECLTGWQLSSAAKSQARAVAAVRSLWIGKFMILCAIVLIFGGVGWFAKHVYDGYSFNSAMGRAQGIRASLVEVIAHLRTAVRIQPDSVKARILLGKALVKAGEPAQAVDMLSEALKHDGGNVEALGLLADAHMALQNYPEAASALIRLSEAKGGAFKTNWQLGVLYLDMMNDPAKAVDALRLAVDSGSECREVRYHLGRALLATGKVDDARKELESAIAPLSQADKASAAREEKFLNDRQKVSEVHVTLADLAEKEGNTEEVMKHLAAAQDAAPSSMPVVERLVKLHLGRGKVQEALLVAEKSMRYLSGNAQFVLMLCDTLEKTGLNDRRLQLLRRLYGRSATTPGLLEMLVAAEAEHGNPDAAARLLDKLPVSKRTGGEFAPAWEAIIQAKIKRGDIKGAEEALKGLGDLTESDARFAVLWCRTLHLQGKGKEAIEYAKRATKRSPDAPTPHLVLGTVYRSLGMAREALQSLQKAIDLGAGPEADYQHGMILWEVGFPEEAAKHFVKAKRAKGLPQHLRLQIDSGLLLLSGNVTSRMAQAMGGDIDYIVSELKTVSTNEGTLLRQIHLTTYGMARYSSIAAGTSLVSPNTEERLRYAKALQAAILPPGTDYTELQSELRTAVESFAGAMAAVVPEARADVDAVRSRYVAAFAGPPDLFGRLAAASKAQADMAAAALKAHPRKADLAARLESIRHRLSARRAVAPGPVQQAVCCDYAVAEMLAALIDVGPQGFTYRVAVDRALSDTAAADGSVTDAFAQLGVSRAACLGLLRIFCRQVENEAKGGGEE